MDSVIKTSHVAKIHTLPYRTIFLEYRRRRPQDLATAVVKYLMKPGTTPPELQVVWETLDRAIKKSEYSYTLLANMKEYLGSRQQAPDETVAHYKTRLARAYELTLRAEEICRRRDQPLKAILRDMNGTALCFSGGGIRSASFSLGALEGLARFSRPKGGDSSKQLLDNLDYLSTVSGGGYIGSWLMAWAARSSFPQVVTQLAQPAPTSGDPEPQPIRHLREYTSYLTPNYGFTLDTLTLGAIVMRNLLLNWMIIVPAIVALLCLPIFLYDFSYGWPFAYQRAGQTWFYEVMGLAILCIVFASSFAVWRMISPPYSSEIKNPSKQGSTVLEFLCFILPLLVGSWLLAEAWAWGYISSELGADTRTFLGLMRWLFVFSVIPPFFMSVVRLRLLWHSDGKARPTPFHKHDGSGRIAWWRLVWSFVAPVIAGSVAALLLAICALKVGDRLVIVDRHHFVVTPWFVIAAVPIIWGVLMVSSSLLSGLLSNIEQEEEREWWARAGGLLFGTLLGWVGLNIIAYFGATVLHWIAATVLASIGVGSGFLAAKAGQSAVTSSGLSTSKLKPEEQGKAARWLAKHNLMAPVAAIVALVSMALALAALTSWLRVQLYDKIVAGMASTLRGATPVEQLDKFQAALFHALRLQPTHRPWLGVVNTLKIDSLAAFIILVGAALIALLANRYVNVNTFSLHGMYRMRLTRAFLGASNFARHPDAFTNFDPDDNIYQADLPCEDAPLHLVNTALNLVATRNMAWQQRKAEPFTFSAVNVGSWRLGYLATDAYAGSRGVRLGTAMAISGAALNPNMGYNSSPLVTLLMTFFNARLGWWLPNPIWPEMRKQPPSIKTMKFLRQNGPSFALLPLLNEALGNTNDTYKWIELTDGGHFENLGLYEMVLRRCRHIVVVDGDADGDLQFEDLGNAMRKIYIDLGVPITFDYPHGFPMKKGIHHNNLYYVRGRIEYSCVDGGDPADDGELLVIKPVLNGSEPRDVLAYALSHPTFPHESTSNQFFNESQFESYRHLGSWTLQKVLDKVRKDATPECDMTTLFARVDEVLREAAARQSAEAAKAKGAGADPGAGS